MAEPVLRCHDLGKRYKLYRHPAQRLLDWIAPQTPHHREYWALRHLSFSVAPGECVAVMGPNGAGKSTLLRLIAGTATPSEGRIETHGRTLALLDLSAGFIPEMTGRRNIDYVARLVGYDAAQVRERLPSIIEFAELGEFIDHPIRTYSSGMFLRLAFAVYAGLDPRVLLVDEALAVGDAAFQRRCLQRIQTLREQQGTAIVLVSHDTTLISQFCQRGLVLDHGQAVFDGSARDAVEALHGILFQKDVPPARAEDESIAYGDGAATITDLWVEDSSGRRTSTIAPGTNVAFCYRVHFHRAVKQPVLGMRLASTQGIVLSSTNTQLYGHRTGDAEVDDVWEVRWQMAPRLIPGSYFLSCGCSYPDRDTFLCRRVDALKLTIIGQARGVGLADTVTNLSVRKLDVAPAQSGHP